MKPNTESKEFKEAITVDEMRMYDAYTIKNHIESKELMYRAAMGIFKSYSMIDKKIAIVCGSGNNGGDGYALACILLDNNTTPHIFTIADRFSRDGKYYYDLAVSKGALCTAFSKIIDFSAYDIVVDCIFGTGFKGCPKNLAKDAINAINKSGAYIISADINSGLNGDTGRSEIAVKSDLTVSIGYYKKGMFLEDAPSLIKDLVNVDIGIVKI